MKEYGQYHCEISEQYYFPEFFADLRLYSYEKSTNNWEYSDGPIHENGKYVVNRWKLASNKNGAHFPIAIEINKHSSVQFNTSLKVNLKRFYEQLECPHGNWFNVPELCNENTKHDSQDTIAADEFRQLDEMEIESLRKEMKMV